MQIIPKQVGELSAYENNTRNHNEQQVEMLAKSIQEFGFTNPILIDDSNIIIAGHGRFAAATHLGLTEVPTIVLGGLTEAQKKAYRIADNKIGEESTWDWEKLELEFDEIMKLDFDINFTGFNLDLDIGNTNFDPEYEPRVDNRDVTEQDLEKAADKLNNSVSVQKVSEVMCPHCGEEFAIQS